MGCSCCEKDVVIVGLCDQCKKDLEAGIVRKTRHGGYYRMQKIPLSGKIYNLYSV